MNRYNISSALQLPNWRSGSQTRALIWDHGLSMASDKDAPKASKITTSLGAAAVALHFGQISKALRQSAWVTSHQLCMEALNHL